MFGLSMRIDHMAPLWALLDRFPAETQDIALLPPSPA
jgi:hypothetical protein